jgi:oligopeptide transport system ATP-binding protein
LKQESDVLVSVQNIKKYFPVNSGTGLTRTKKFIKAVDDVSFDIYRGETLGLVGESGCGKTTIGRVILQFYRATKGKIIFGDMDLSQLSEKEIRKLRPKIQMIFQDPYSSLNPRMKVGKIIDEPLMINTKMKKSEREKQVRELLEIVGLNPYFEGRFPHEFSGGQRQRVGIARALALHPDLIVCDEPISALDVSVQAQVVNLLRDLQDEFRLTYLFIAHDLSMVQHISQRVAVMYLGKLMELAPKEVIFEHPLHPYTKALLSAVPVPDPVIERQRTRIILEGDLPSPVNPPTGCRFNTRCPVAFDKCYVEEPIFRELEPGHYNACWLDD